MKRKWATIGIILLFVGITYAPTINFNTVKAFQENDFIEVTTQACGIKGYGNTTVKLTREQYRDLEQFLGEFQAEIHQTSTWEKTAVLFRQAVIRLHTYGLLPKNMGVAEAQRLVTTGYQMPKLMDLCPSVNSNKQFFNDSNFLCLLTGITTSSCIIGIAELGIAALIYLLLFPYFLEGVLCNDPVIMEQVLARLRQICISLQAVSSRRIIQTGNIVFGTSKDAYIPPEFRFFPAYGWIETQGLFGKKSWNGTFFGSLRTLRGFEFGSYSYYIGAADFVGLKVDKGDGKNFFLGSALRCDLDYFDYQRYQKR